MKKIIIPVGALLLSATTLFYSCTKTSTSNHDQLANLGKAKISGFVWATTDETSSGADTQYAPSGTVIKAWIDSKEFLYYTGDSATPYAPRYYSATVGADGKYSLTVDVSKFKMAMVHIEPVTFTHDLKKDSAGEEYTFNRTYKSTATIIVPVENDDDKTQRIDYTHN
jgi:hypothetical protein